MVCFSCWKVPSRYSVRGLISVFGLHLQRKAGVAGDLLRVAFLLERRGVELHHLLSFFDDRAVRHDRQDLHTAGVAGFDEAFDLDVDRAFDFALLDDRVLEGRIDHAGGERLILLALTTASHQKPSADTDDGRDHNRGD
jgi:hypothetical protein